MLKAIVKDRPGASIFALMTMAMACDLTTFVMPLIVGALVAQHGLSDAQVGFVATAQLMCCALLSFGLAPYVRQLNPRLTIAIGLVLVALGNAFTLVPAPTFVLVGARLAAGFGEALVNVVVGVLVARRPDPDRGFAMVNIGITSGAVLVFVLAPVMVASLGKDCIFWILTVLPMVSMPFIRWIPSGRLDAGAPAQRPRGLAGFGLTWPSVALLVGIVGFGIAGNAVFIFVERIGEGVGVGYNQLVQMMLWVTVWTAAGPVAARIIGTRFGRMPVLAISFLGLAIACPMMGAPPSALVLFVGLNIGGFCLLFATPFYSGLMVAMDPQGRLITLSRGVLAIGSAITPGIASLMLLGGGGFPAMGYWSSVTAVVSLVLVWYAARSVRPSPLDPKPVWVET
jgi:predicted MFS family arabinose efflux permease